MVNPVEIAAFMLINSLCPRMRLHLLVTLTGTYTHAHTHMCYIYIYENRCILPRLYSPNTQGHKASFTMFLLHRYLKCKVLILVCVKINQGLTELHW